MFRVIARNFSILTAAQIAGAAVIFLFAAFVARQLGPELFGTFILVGAYVRFISLTVNAGVGPIAFRELARRRDDPLELFEDIVTMRLMLGLIGYAGLMGTLILLDESRDLLILVAISAITLVLDPFIESYAAYYTSRERVVVPAAISVVAALLSAAGGIVVLLAGYGIVALIVSEVALSLVVTLAWTIAFRAANLRFAFRVRVAAWRRLLIMTIPFAPIHICSQLNRVLNVILLGRLNGPLPAEQSVGYYGPAQTITNGAVNLVVSLRRVLIPPVTARLAEGHSVTAELDVALKLAMALFALPMVLATSFMAPELITLLFGERYAPSAVALTLLGWAAALQIASIVPEAFLFSHPDHRMQDYIAGALMSVLGNVLLCVLLIEDYGIAGAALGAVTGRLVYFFYIAQYCRRQLGREALRLRRFGDAALLVVAGFGIWYFLFAAIQNRWLASAAAFAATLPLIAGFMLWLRKSREPAVQG